ncbi:unnamed protein product, partial [Staurois parvus]
MTRDCGHSKEMTRDGGTRTGGPEMGTQSGCPEMRTQYGDDRETGGMCRGDRDCGIVQEMPGEKQTTEKGMTRDAGQYGDAQKTAKYGGCRDATVQEMP